MKKIYLTILMLIFIAPVSSFGQWYLRVETGPNFYLPNQKTFSVLFPYPHQIYYRSGVFLKYRMNKHFNIGIGIQQESLEGCIACLKSYKPTRLLQISYGYFFKESQDSCVASWMSKEFNLNVPLEIGYTYRRNKKSPWGFNLNARIKLYGYGEHHSKFRGDTVKIDLDFKRHEWIEPRFLDWSVALGVSYRPNKRTFLSLDLVPQVFLPHRPRFIGLNIGLDYALTKP